MIPQRGRLSLSGSERSNGRFAAEEGGQKLKVIVEKVVP